MTVTSARVNRDSPISLQRQVLSSLLRQIDDGTYKSGDRLPTEKQLASSLGASLAPIRIALRQLELAGRVVRTQGQGTFVSEKPVRYELRLISSSTDSLRRAGVPFTVDVIDQSFSVPPGHAAEKLGLAHGESAFHLKRVISVRGKPVVLLESWVVEGFAAGLTEKGRFAHGESLYRALAESGAEQQSASGQVCIHNATESEADLLGKPFGAPLLLLASTTYDAQNKPVDHSFGLYDSASFSLEMDYIPPNRTDS